MSSAPKARGMEASTTSALDMIVLIAFGGAGGAPYSRSIWNQSKLQTNFRQSQSADGKHNKAVTRIKALAFRPIFSCTFGCPNTRWSFATQSGDWLPSSHLGLDHVLAMVAVGLRALNSGLPRFESCCWRS